jgi:hypothetical protein
MTASAPCRKRTGRNKIALQATADLKTAQVRLSLRDGDVQRDVTIPYGGSLRYPHLERIAGARDWLIPLLFERQQGAFTSSPILTS